MTQLDHFLICDLTALTFDELCDLYNRTLPLMEDYPLQSARIQERVPEIVQAMRELDNANKR